MSRGIEVLRLKKDIAAASTMKAVTAPSVRKNDKFAAKPVSSLSATSTHANAASFICPLFDQRMSGAAPSGARRRRSITRGWTPPRC